MIRVVDRDVGATRRVSSLGSTAVLALEASVKTDGHPRVIMNRYERRPLSPGEAQLQFLDGDLRVLRPGAFVRCAVTGEAIPIDDLRYWSVERQEAYSSRDAVMERLRMLGRAPG